MWLLWMSLTAFAAPEDAFARKALAMARKMQTSCTYNEELFAIECDGRTSFLGNSWAEAQEQPRRTWKPILERYLRLGQAIPEVPESLADAREHLLPRIRRRDFYDSIPYLVGADAPTTWSRPVAETISLDVVFDMPTQMLNLTSTDLQRWSLSEEEALSIAVENLRALQPSPFEQVKPGIYLSEHGDSYDPSRLLLTDQILAMTLEGDPIALLVDEGGLVIAGSESDHIGMLVSLLASDDTKPVSFDLYRLHDGRWSSWLPPEDHPYHDVLAKYAWFQQSAMYELMVKAMRSAADRPDNDGVFVAARLHVETPSGDDRVVVSIGPVPTRFGLADYAGVNFDDGNDPLFVPMDDLRRILGDRITPYRDFTPPWWEFNGDLSGTKEAMQAVAVDISAI